jgi:hypothetical protein
VLGRDCQAHQGRGVDSSLTWVPANVSALNTFVEGSRCGGGEPTRPSSEAEPHPRGVTAPRERQNLTLGGDCPSSEAEPHPRERSALERGETSLEGAPSPRAR